MGNQDGGLAPPGLPKVLQDGRLGLGVHGGHGIVQNQYGRVLHQRPGDGDSLLLASGHRHAPLPQDGVVALLELLDIAVHVRKPGRLGDGSGVVLFHAEGDIVLNGVGEQEIILGHIGAARPQVPNLYIVHVIAVNEQRPVRHIVSAQDQVHQSGLAGAGLAHQTYVLPRLDGEGYIFQYVIFPIGIPECQIPELDVPADTFQALGSLPVHQVNLRVQQLPQPV